MTLRFSTFYASVPSLNDGNLVHPHAITTHEQAIAMLNMLLMSARRFNPNAKFSILTSETTDLSQVDLDFDRIDIQVDRYSVMLDRTFGQWKQVVSMPRDETLILLDADIVVQADLTELDDAPFDVGLTWRRDKMPINGGVIVARNRGEGRAAAFFSLFLRHYQERPASEWRWYGDQLTLRDLIPAVEPWTGRMLASSYEDCAVSLLHCDVYNYSPPDETECFTVPALQDRLMIHFKGHRKRFMASYFDDLLQAADREQSEAGSHSISPCGPNIVSPIEECGRALLESPE